MTGNERIVRAESILRRQRTGEITREQGAAEFDALLDAESGDLHYFSDTTTLKSKWHDEPVMVLHLNVETQQASNTGLIVQGEKRGLFVSLDGVAESNAVPEQLAHFRYNGKGLAI